MCDFYEIAVKNQDLVLLQRLAENFGIKNYNKLNKADLIENIINNFYTDVCGFSFSNENLECPICFNISENTVKIINCRHNFCKNCLVNWLEQSNSCPLCRTDLC